MLVAALLAMAACAPVAAPLPHEAWAPSDHAPTALEPTRPPGDPCPFGWWMEGPYLEVNTGDCRWFLMHQPLPARSRGSRLTGGLAWDDLANVDEEARPPSETPEGLAQIFVGDTLVWEHRQPIPSPPGFTPIEAPLPAGLPAGTPVYLHLRNHGINHWRWLPITQRPSP